MQIYESIRRIVRHAQKIQIRILICDMQHLENLYYYSKDINASNWGFCRSQCGIRNWFKNQAHCPQWTCRPAQNTPELRRCGVYGRFGKRWPANGVLPSYFGILASFHDTRPLGHWPRFANRPRGTDDFVLMRRMQLACAMIVCDCSVTHLEFIDVILQLCTEEIGFAKILLKVFSFQGNSQKWTTVRDHKLLKLLLNII